MNRFFLLWCLLVFGVTLNTGVACAVPQSADVKSSADETPQETGVNLEALVGEKPAPKNVSLARPATVLAVYSILIIAASLVGGWLPSWVRLTHTRMQTVISLVGGLMLGIGVFHLLPHAMNSLGDAALTSRWIMVGIVVMFVLIRLFHFHNHEPTADNHSDCDHDHHHSGEHALGAGHSAAVCHSHGHSHGFSWMGIALGLSMHTLIDGIVLGASVYADGRLDEGRWLLGIGTFLAIVFHKPLDAVSITSLMASSGWSGRSINLVNIGFAMMCPLGAVLMLLGVSQFSGYQQELVGTALEFAAGVFICIALSDLLPEMEFHSHNKVQLTVALGLGIGISLLMAMFHPHL